MNQYNLLSTDPKLPTRSRLPSSGCSSMALAVLFLVSSVSQRLSVSFAFAAQENCNCSTVDHQVSISGEFAASQGRRIGGDPGCRPQYERRFARKSTARLSPSPSANLPAGKYTVVIGETETLLDQAGRRLFDVTSGILRWHKNFDIIATAGSAQGLLHHRPVEHDDDFAPRAADGYFHDRRTMQNSTPSR